MMMRNGRVVRLVLLLVVGALALPACSQKGKSPQGSTTPPPGRPRVETPRETPRHEPGIAHVVQPGETWAGLAEDYYGDTARARGLQRANPDNTAAPAPGDTLFIPFTEREREAYAGRAQARGPYNEGLALAQRGEYPDAILKFEEAIAVDPKLARAHYNLGLVYQRAGEARRAASCLQKACELAPSADTHYALGLAQREIGEMGKAERSFRAALELDPDHLPSLYALARSLDERGSGEAERYWRAVLARDPEGPRGREAASALGLASGTDSEP